MAVEFRDRWGGTPWFRCIAGDDLWKAIPARGGMQVSRAGWKDHDRSCGEKVECLLAVSKLDLLAFVFPPHQIDGYKAAEITAAL